MPAFREGLLEDGQKSALKICKRVYKKYPRA